MTHIVRKEGSAALVEYDHDGKLARVTVPSGLDLETADLNQGIPYGLPWEEIAASAGISERAANKLADRLRRAGIWTADDLLAHPREALGALQAAYKLDLIALTAKAQQYNDRR